MLHISNVGTVALPIRSLGIVDDRGYASSLEETVLFMRRMAAPENQVRLISHPGFWFRDWVAQYEAAHSFKYRGIVHQQSQPPVVPHKISTIYNS